MSRSKTNGFSLIEVLVSLLVLGVGVIGAAGMQLAAMRTAQQSVLQTFALHLATEMADALRASGSYAGQAAQSNPLFEIDYRGDGEPAVPAKLCYAEACDASEFAEFEVYEWKKRVQSTFPGGRLLVCRDSTPWNDAQKRLVWDCAPGSDGNAPLVVKLGWQAKNPDGSKLSDRDDIAPPGIALAIAI